MAGGARATRHREQGAHGPPNVPVRHLAHRERGHVPAHLRARVRAAHLPAARRRPQARHPGGHHGDGQSGLGLLQARVLRAEVRRRHLQLPREGGRAGGRGDEY